MDDLILYVNDSFVKTYGYSREDLLGKPIGMVRSGKNNPDVIAGVIPATRNGGWRGELVNTRKDGSEFIVNIATSIIYDGLGTPVAYLGIARDITETKRMQEKFRAVAELFQSLGTDTARNITTIVTCACEIIEGAASLYNRLDQRSNSLVIWSGHNIPPGIPLTDKPEGHICYEATIKGSHQAVVIPDLSETIYMQTDPNVARYGLKSYLGCQVFRRGLTIGSLAVVDNVVRNFTSEEINILGILARALTLEEERQDALTLLETAVQQSPSGVLIADAPDSRIRIINSQAFRILYGANDPGPFSLKHESNRTWQAFRPDGALVSKDELPLNKAINYGELTENEEFIIKNEPGEAFYVSVNAAPVRNCDGLITAGIVIFHDISAKHRAERELQAKVEELERFNHLMVGRELKMIELKKEVNELLTVAGMPEKYIIHE